MIFFFLNDCGRRTFCLPRRGNVRTFTEENEKDRVCELYRVSFRVGRDVIILLARGTNGSIETPDYWGNAQLPTSKLLCPSSTLDLPIAQKCKKQKRQDKKIKK